MASYKFNAHGKLTICEDELTGKISAYVIYLRAKELQNIWRKKALGSLISEVQLKAPKGGDQNSLKRLRRFTDVQDTERKWLRLCIEHFREVCKLLEFFNRLR